MNREDAFMCDTADTAYILQKGESLKMVPGIRNICRVKKYIWENPKIIIGM